MTKKLTCVPAYLHPAGQMEFSSCEVMPGVKVVRLVGGLRNAVTSTVDNIPRDIGFGPTHGILIDRQTYVTKLETRLALEGESLPRISKGRMKLTAADVFVPSQQIAMQAVLSLILAGGIFFKFRGAVHLKYRPTQSQRYRSTGYSHGELHSISEWMQAAQSFDNPNWTTIDSRRLRAFAANLDRYFRGGMWWNDRLSMALAYYWEAICTRSPHQSFLGLCTALEALVSPGSMEITHKLAERIAILTASTSSDREHVYSEVKSLYGVRSKLVHGSVRPKKGKYTQATLIVSPRFSNVPFRDLGRLHTVTSSTLRVVLKNREFLGLIQRHASERDIDKDVNRYFLENLFR